MVVLVLNYKALMKPGDKHFVKAQQREELML